MSEPEVYVWFNNESACRFRAFADGTLDVELVGDDWTPVSQPCRPAVQELARLALLVKALREERTEIAAAIQEVHDYLNSPMTPVRDAGLVLLLLALRAILDRLAPSVPAVSVEETG